MPSSAIDSYAECAKQGIELGLYSEITSNAIVQLTEYIERYVGLFELFC